MLNMFLSCTKQALTSENKGTDCTTVCVMSRSSARDI